MNARNTLSAALVLALAGALVVAGEREVNLGRLLERFPEADANGDGKLTLEEARAFWQKRRTTQTGQDRGENRPAAEKLLAVHEARTFKGMPYRLMKPIDLADHPDKAYPLVLSLHGAGGRGSDNIKNLRPWNGVLAEEARRRKHPCFVVVPQTEVPWTVAGSTPELTDERVATFPEAWRKVIERRRARGMASDAGDLGKVFDLLDALAKEFTIDRDRVYVLGHSMGGAGTWNAIGAQPERFAAAIPTAGGFAPWHDAKQIADVPIWAFHGESDPVVPVELTRLVFGQLKGVGGNMKYTELKGVRHNVNTFAFVYTGDDASRGFVTQYAGDRCDKTADVWDWLFARKRRTGK